jgi:hypothetical protein
MEDKTCKLCGGEGTLTCSECNGSGEGMADDSTCLICKGNGEVPCDCTRKNRPQGKEDWL